MNRVFVAIDGGNIYRKLKKLGISNLTGFDYQRFIKYLVGENKLVCICYYIGRIREEIDNPKSRLLKANQDKFLANLQKMNIPIKAGYILKSDGEYMEKGVDVQIAIDICMKAARNEYDRLILISSDTDLIPAVKEAKSLGKTIEYIGFEPTLSFALIRFSDLRRILRKDDLIQFTKTKV